jgi:acetyltransferase-like isoleucine patch superfamily enzyme
MWRKIAQLGIDPLLARLARRLEWVRSEAVRNERHCAHIDPTATMHATASIQNILGTPEAIVVGAHTHVRGELLTFWNSGQIRIGEWCYIGEGTRIWSQASISIGDYVLIAHLVDVHDTNSHPINWQERRLDSEAILGGGDYRTPTQTLSAPVIIEDDVWIGFKASILKGVTIGRGAIVSAGAVVTKNVEPWTIVAGNPARVIGTLESRESQSTVGVAEAPFGLARTVGDE